MQRLDARLALDSVQAMELRVALVKAFVRHEGDADIAAALDAVDFLARAVEIVESLDHAA